MSKKARLIAALSAPIIGGLAFVGFAVGAATPAAAASPITFSGGSLQINLPPVFITINNL